MGGGIGDFKCLFIKSPVTTDYWQYLENKEEYKSDITAVGDKFGFEFINFNDEHHWDAMKLENQKHFADQSHLTKTGAIMFSNYLIETLIRIKLID